MAAGSFRLIVRQGANPDRMEEFKESARQAVASTEAAEPGTLGYEWFVAEDGSDCCLNEFYVSSEAFLTHFQNIGPTIAKMLEMSPLLEAIVLGDPEPEARKALAAIGAKFYKPLAGFSRLR